jgi:hypothetical protein
MNTDFKKLYDRFKIFAESTRNTRLLNALKNYERNPEYICRKMGVISEQDINRISKIIP